MLDMIGYLKSAFTKIIEDIDWMDDLTKERAFGKLKTMRRFIAYPDELTDESVVTEYHSEVDVDEEDFYGNQASSLALYTVLVLRMAHRKWKETK